MDTWDSQPTPEFDGDEVQAQFDSMDLESDSDGGIVVNDPYLRDTVIEGYVVCPECQTHNYIRNLGIGDHLKCENCETDVEISEGNITHSGSNTTTKEARSTTGSLKLQTIGKYKIERFIALGGMGEVYLGHHPNLNIPVAIKVLSNDTIRKHPQMRERFLMEAQTAAKMNHTNICRVYDADCEGDLFFIVMEFIPGGDVLQYAKKNGGKLDSLKALDVITGVAEALREASKYTIIHRDIKPENIMLSEDGTIKLADLGIAKSVDVERSEGTWSTFTNAVLGTPGYIAPEQSMNARDVDCRTDIYSLGATFYHLVTGQLPFRASSPFQMMYKHVKEPLTDPRELEPDLPENIANVIKKMMEKDPGDRYQSAAELLVDLRRIKEQNAPIDYSPNGGEPGTKGASKSGSGGIVKMMIVAAAIVVVGVGIYFGLQGTNKPPEVVVNQPPPPTVPKEDPEKIANIAKYRSEFDRAIEASNFKSANLALETLEQLYPEDRSISYDMRIKLNEAETAALAKKTAETAKARADVDEAIKKAAFENARRAITDFQRLHPKDPVIAELTELVARAEADKAKELATMDLQRKLETIKTDFNQAIAAGDPRRAEFSLKAFTDLAPKDVDLYKMGVALEDLRHRQETEPLLAAAEAAWNKLIGLHLAPGQRIGDRIDAIGNSLTNGRNLFKAGNFVDATTTFRKVQDDIETVIADDAKRRAVAPLLADIQKMRKQIVTDASEKLPEFAGNWSDAEKALEQATNAFENGIFNQVEPQATRVRTNYEFIIKNDGLIRKRNTAKQALEATLKAANIPIIEKHAPEMMNGVNREIRLAENSDKDYGSAAEHYSEGLRLLQQAEITATKTAATEARETILNRHNQAVTTAERLFAEANDAKKLGNLEDFRTKTQQAIASLGPALGPEAQELVKDSNAAALKSTFETAITRAFAKPEQGKKWVIPDLELEMLPIKPGTFNMGSTTGHADEAPVHPVTITKPFWAGVYEVTQRQYMVLTNGNPSRQKRMANPVDSVSWIDAAAFCKRLNQLEKQAGRLPDGYQYRLPTEAEWEYFCRAGSTGEYFFGDDYALLHKFGNYRDASNRAAVSWRDALHDDRNEESARVGFYPENKWGLHDVHGNVAEWVADNMGPYPSKAVSDPTGPDRGTKRILRGGAWTTSYQDCRSAARVEDIPERNFYGNGFRLVLAPVLDTPDERAGVWGP